MIVDNLRSKLYIYIKLGIIYNFNANNKGDIMETYKIYFTIGYKF